MTDESESRSTRPALPKPAIEKRRGLPLVWLIPLMAAVVGAWLAWTTLSERGPTITLVFDAANGVEEGKTPIKYRDVPLGIVQTVELSEDLTHVVITARMEKHASEYLRAGTRFWIESARLTASGVSGLNTLLSGVYIGMLPGSGEPQDRFVGLEQPPVLQLSVPGRSFVLRAEELGSIAAGAPIYFRGIRVGEVLGHALDEDAKAVSIFIFVRAPHDVLVRDRTHFWNASGIDVSIGANGLKLRTESLVTIMEGGIAFDTPLDASAGQPSPEGAEFRLFASYDSIREGEFTERVPFLLHFAGSVAGLEPGAPVVLRGIQIGVVREVRLEVDVSDYTVRIPVLIELEPQRAVVVGGSSDRNPRDRIVRFVEKGLRAQLQSGNLLTGSLLVALDFLPKQPAAEVTYEDGYPVIPTVPSDIQELKENATIFVQNLAKAPVAELVADLRATVQDVDRIVASKGVQEGIGPLVDSLKQTSDAARATLAQAEGALQSADEMIAPDSALRFDLVRLIKELSEMARAVRTLSESLERQPQSVIFGKRTEGEN
jgi:paraquat-inducible protein B